MPYEQSPSPVAPEISSRLWTVGASGGFAVLVMVGLAIAEPSVAGPLLAGAGAAALASWLASRRPPAAVAHPSAAPDTPRAEVASATLLIGMFDALADPVLLIAGGEIDDIAGRRVALANRAARDLFRIEREGALLVALLRSPEVLEAVDEALFAETANNTAYEAGGAQPRHWRAWTCPIPTREGPPVALLSLHDETDARRMELMRVDFLANASHELRTPLASLSGFIETLKGHAREDPVARDRFLEIMSVQADRMGRLVADLLSLSRIELNEHIRPSGQVDLVRIATEVVDAMGVLAGEAGVGLTLSPGPARLWVAGDRDELVQVVQNLVDNAVKYSPPGGTVEIGLEAGVSAEAAVAPRLKDGFRLSLVTPDRETETRYAVVSVRDYGPGMAREHLPRLAERFYRVEGQKSGERPGTGLGLSIVKHITNRHRGGLVVESVQGEGTLFRVYFPQSRPEAAGPTL